MFKDAKEAQDEKNIENHTKWENTYKVNRLDKLKQMRQNVMNK